MGGMESGTYMRYYNRKGEPIGQTEMLAIYSGDFETERQVARTDATDEASVSTVFLCLNHQYGDGPPIIFETMVFGGEHDEWCDRYATEDEARAGHEAVVAWLRGERSEPRMAD